MVSTHPAFISDRLAETQSFLKQQLQSTDKKLEPYVDYIKNRYGKMIRASLLLLSGSLFGELNQTHIKVAAIVEMIHAATLLHDDVIDDGQVRRFSATANNLWGSNMAVLLGDYLLSKAFCVNASLERNDITAILCETTEIICRGEMLQNAFRGDINISTAEYLNIIEKKTAAFFANAALLGGVISHANDMSCKSLYDFGLNLGLAFQITDDLLDLTGSEKDIGKNTGKDLQNDILTMPVIEGIDFTKNEISKYRQKASLALDRFGQSPASAAMRELAVSVTTV